MKNNPLISVVIPLYNKEKTIEQSLNSVLLQKDCEFEVVVVDDGSTDNSVEQVKKIINPKIKLVSQPNGGPGAARNTGAQAAMVIGLYFWMLMMNFCQMH